MSNNPLISGIRKILTNCKEYLTDTSMIPYDYISKSVIVIIPDSKDHQGPISI